MKNTYRLLQIAMYVFAGAMLLLLCSSSLLKRGMFLDGMWYACIARNMSEGIGTFWHPIFDSATLQPFYDHPPLAMFLQSLAFRLCGDSIYVEKIYSVLMVTIVMLCTVLIWKKCHHSLRSGWMPLMMLSLMSLVSWTMANNMLENTMTIFVLLSMWFFLLSKKKNHYLNIVISALMLFSALLCKGLPALFPLAVPFCYWICIERKDFWKSAVMDTLIMLFVIGVALSIVLFTNPNALRFVTIYFNMQYVYAAAKVVTVSTRFAIICKLLEQIVLPIVLLAIIFFIGYKKGQSFKNIRWRNVLFWLCVGLCGTLPLMITMKQRGFYLVPALPCYALALAEMLYIVVKDWHIGIKSSKVMIISSIILMIIAIGLNVYHIGQEGRDVNMQKDVDTLLGSIDNGSIIEVTKDQRQNFGLCVYAQRYYHATLIYNDGSGIYKNVTPKYLILDKHISVPDSLGKIYAPCKENRYSIDYDLYYRKKAK